jgi:hypothetical protein
VIADFLITEVAKILGIFFTMEKFVDIKFVKKCVGQHVEQFSRTRHTFQGSSFVSDGFSDKSFLSEMWLPKTRHEMSASNVTFAS